MQNIGKELGATRFRLSNIL